MGTNTLRLQRRIITSVSGQKPKRLRLSHSGRRRRPTFEGRFASGVVELLVRGVTAPQRTVFQPPIWELSNRSGVGGASLSTVLGWVDFGARSCRYACEAS